MDRLALGHADTGMSLLTPQVCGELESVCESEIRGPWSGARLAEPSQVCV